MGLFNGKCTSTTRLDGKIVIVTGSNTGIGKATASDLYKRGAHIIMACRNLDKARTAIEDIVEESKMIPNVGHLEYVELNLCSLESVRRCAKEILEKHSLIDILINNAGIMACPYAVTEDNFEIQFGTNHLGHFLFTLLLMTGILRAKHARVVNVSSLLHNIGYMDFEDINWEKRPYKPYGAYGQSKLANILFSKELVERLKEANIDNVTVYSLHPGVVHTDLGRDLDKTYNSFVKWLWYSFAKPFIKTPLEGAQTTIYCAVDEKAGKESGLYYSDCKPKVPNMKARNKDDAKKLWDMSVKMVGLEGYDLAKI